MRDNKAITVANIAALEGEDEALKLIAQLKVTLLADAFGDGGINETSRKRAWAMVNDLGQLLLQRR